MFPGDGLEVSEVALTHPDLAGIHFTGSTATFKHLWRTVGENIGTYRGYPLPVGDVTDFANFTGAVIDARSFAKNKAAIDRAHAEPGIEVLAGGTYDDSVGYFIRPTLVRCDDPADEVFTTEYFGPFLAVHVYDDADFDAVLDTVDSGTVVGQQPFGGARASGTDDKAGSPLNLLRWVTPRVIKETFVPPTDHRYPHMG